MKSPVYCLTLLLLAALGTIHAADTPPQPANVGKPSASEVKPMPFDFDKEDAEAHVAYFLQNRKSAAADPYRPLYHFSPPGFGLHDPAGLCRWQPGKSGCASCRAQQGGANDH